jgi:hypothetical protein
MSTVSFSKVGQKRNLGVTAIFVRVDIFPYLVLRIFFLMDKSDAPALQSFLNYGHLVDTGALARCQNQIVSLRRTHNVVQSFTLWKKSPVDHVEYLQLATLSTLSSTQHTQKSTETAPSVTLIL